MPEEAEKNVLKGHEAFELYKKRKEEWNDWAQEHKNWEVDFSEWDFSSEEAVDFSDFIFPGNASFYAAKFGNGKVSFNRAVFNGPLASFAKADFGEEGVEFMNTDFSDADVYFQSAYFGKGELFFQGTIFGNVSFRDAHFECPCVNFNFAEFGKGVVNFYVASHNGANFAAAQFKETEVKSGGFFQGASFFDTNFGGISLKRQSLDRADLTDATNLRLDGNSIRETRFSPYARDPYSILRRSYTGTKFTLVLLFTLFAILPFSSKAFTYSMIGSAQELLIDSNILSPDVETEIILASEPVSTFSVVSGWSDENRWWSIGVFVTILAYNFVRGWVTLGVVALREAEERSLRAPLLTEYWRLYLVHQYFLKWAFYGVLMITAFRAFEVLSQPIRIPITAIL